jgi:hypothetical protein
MARLMLPYRSTRPRFQAYREPGKGNVFLPNRGTMVLVGAGAMNRILEFYR